MKHFLTMVIGKIIASDGFHGKRHGIILEQRNVAQLGSAPALGAGGRWFKSSRSD